MWKTNVSSLCTQLVLTLRIHIIVVSKLGVCSVSVPKMRCLPCPRPKMRCLPCPRTFLLFDLFFSFFLQLNREIFFFNVNTNFVRSAKTRAIINRTKSENKPTKTYNCLVLRKSTKEEPIFSSDFQKTIWRSFKPEQTEKSPTTFANKIFETDRKTLHSTGRQPCCSLHATCHAVTTWTPWWHVDTTAPELPGMKPRQNCALTRDTRHHEKQDTSSTVTYMANTLYAGGSAEPTGLGST